MQLSFLINDLARAIWRWTEKKHRFVTIGRRTAQFCFGLFHALFVFWTPPPFAPLDS